MAGAAIGQSPASRARGAAVVLAMLLAAFAAAVAATVFADQQRWSRSVEHRRDQVQAQAIAIAGVQWARQILFDDARASAIDDLSEPWALRLPPIPLDNGEIRGAIIDAQSRLNINALGDAGTRAEVERSRIARLFAQRRGPVAALPAIADWTDRDSIVRAGGAEDAWYLARPSPSLTANAPVIRISEIAAVRGVTDDSLAAVGAFITALPPGTPVNVNTASAEVLAAILDAASVDAIAALTASRAQKPFTTVAEFRARLPSGVRLDSEDALDVKSRFFEVTIEARQGATVARARALVRREPEHWPVIVWQIVE
ncbi:MAG: type II secretion system minor pseudopilin GspK [Betaproteobacteria bacterium]